MPSEFGLLRAGLALAGLAAAVALGWRTLSGADLAVAFTGWMLPAVVLLQLVQQAGCGLAWRSLVEPPRPSRWAFVRARWIRASVAALVPVSGIGAALAAVRVAMRAGLTIDVAGASLTLDAAMELLAQIVFTAFGIGLLLASSPHRRVPGPALAALGLAALAAAVLLAAQRGGALKLVDAGLARLAGRWPGLFPTAAASLHDRLRELQRRRRASLVAGSLHLGCWLLGAGEVWLVLAALGHPATLSDCIVVESLGMTARSAGFLVPGALGVQEGALVVIGQLVGLPAEAAFLVAIVKRLRDVAIGVPGLLLWQWSEGGRLRLARAPAKTADGSGLRSRS